MHEDSTFGYLNLKIVFDASTISLHINNCHYGLGSYVVHGRAEPDWVFNGICQPYRNSINQHHPIEI